MRGFSFVELVVAMAIVLAVAGHMFGFVNSARRVFEIDLERADMQQRARVSIDALFRDLVMAGSGLQAPAVAPFRRGAINADTPGSAFTDRVSVRFVPPDAVGAVTITYAIRPDASGVPQLMRYDGVSTELPVVDQIANLRFDYFDAAGQPIAIARFTDGPWVPNAVAADRYDADLDAIVRVRAVVTVRPSRSFTGISIGDLALVFDISPRNLQP